MNIKIFQNIASKIIRIVTLAMVLVFVVSACMPESFNKKTSGSADQIHFSLIDQTSVTFDWTGTTEFIVYGTNPGKLKRAVRAEHPAFLPVITFGHRSAYTSTNRRSPGEKSLQAILNKLHAGYSKYKLDISGHNHQYERYLLPEGMTYVVNVSTGSYYHEDWQTPVKPENCAFRAIHYGILVLDISEDSINGRLECSAGSTQPGPDYMPLEEAVCENTGAVIDSFTIKAD